MASTAVSMTGGTPGQFSYAALGSPITLAANQRSLEARLAACRMIVAPDHPVPTALGILVLAHQPGLGDLMITSINNGDEPIMNGLVFLTSLVYCLAVLATDLCYAMFDPRIRLR